MTNKSVMTFISVNKLSVCLCEYFLKETLLLHYLTGLKDM